MQYEQKLLQPYMIDTHALRFDERTTGMPSAILPAESSTAKMRLFVRRTLCSSSGKRHSSCGLNTPSTWR